MSAQVQHDAAWYKRRADDYRAQCYVDKQRTTLPGLTSALGFADHRQMFVKAAEDSEAGDIVRRAILQLGCKG